MIGAVGILGTGVVQMQLAVVSRRESRTHCTGLLHQYRISVNTRFFDVFGDDCVILKIGQ